MKSKPTIPVIAVVVLLVGVMYSQQGQSADSQKAASRESRPLKVVYREPPVYPAEAKAKDIQGIVVVEAVVGRQGNVISARVIEGDKIFADAAVAAVKAWKFEPAMSQGQPIEKTTQIKICFCGNHGRLAG